MSLLFYYALLAIDSLAGLMRYLAAIFFFC